MRDCLGAPVASVFLVSFSEKFLHRSPFQQWQPESMCWWDLVEVEPFLGCKRPACSPLSPEAVSEALFYAILCECLLFFL